MTKLNGDLSTIRYPDRKLPRNTPFTRLPDDLFHEGEWGDITCGRWKFGDHITLGESRTVVKLVQLLGREVGDHNKVILSLQVNQPTAGSMTKGRSPAPALNFLLRKKAARCLAAAIRLMLPWVETSKQPADRLSRVQ